VCRVGGNTDSDMQQLFFFLLFYGTLLVLLLYPVALTITLFHINVIMLIKTNLRNKLSLSLSLYIIYFSQSVLTTSLSLSLFLIITSFFITLELLSSFSTTITKISLFALLLPPSACEWLISLLYNILCKTSFLLFYSCYKM